MLSRSRFPGRVQQEVPDPSSCMRATWPSSPTTQRAPEKSSHTIPLGSKAGGVPVPPLSQGQLPRPPPMFVPEEPVGHFADAGWARRARDRMDDAAKVMVLSIWGFLQEERERFVLLVGPRGELSQGHLVL